MPERESRVATAMPIFQLFTTARSKLDTNPPAPESDYVELVWENGQILEQGQSQSNRARRSGFHPSVSLTSNWSEAETRKKAGKLRGLDFGLGELSAPPIGLGQEDDVVPWLSYPFNGSLHSEDFCSDLLPEWSRIAGVADGGQPLVCKNSDSMRFLENSVGGEFTVARAGATQPAHLNPSSSAPQHQSRFRSKFLEDAGKVKAMATEDQGRADQGSALCSFPCFSRRATLFGPDTDDPKASVLDRSDQVDLNFAGSSGVKQSENKQDAGTVIVEVSDVLHDRNEAENGKVGGRTGCGATEAGGIAAEGEKNMDHWDSSVCSGNTVERDACDPKLWLKRKSRDNDESDAPSEPTQRDRGEQLQDVDEELVCEKKQVPLSSRGTTSKRSRAAEVHNLSERRRRDRINEKMRTLQELIPNCNKADKASMLDEAIEYLKTLQLQVQMMTMGAGLYIPPIMLPTGIHNMPLPNMPHFPHIGLGMGPGIGYSGMGLNADNSVTHCPMVHIPLPVHGGHLPTMHHGMLPGAFGYPGQGIPMSMPRTPFHPLSATSAVTSVTSGYGMAPTTTLSSSKEAGPRITTPTSTNFSCPSTNFSCPGYQPPPQFSQIQSSRETSDTNAMDSGGPTITSNGT